MRRPHPGLHNGNKSALQWYLDVARETPKWADHLMTIRNLAVGLLGLKDVGSLADVPPNSAAHTLREGDRAGIFTIRNLQEHEVVLQIEDSHLDVFVSVLKENSTSPTLTVSTIVFNHNLLGKIYMLPVAPLHKVIVHAMLAKGHAIG
ncbi:MAG: DUF2867 domain-containing protein [Limnobacter sp.]|nr:DUF2867 domain-containing protein [Limnobacter sp.]